MSVQLAVPLRGQVYFIESPRVGRKPVLIVSNNRRNRALPDVLAARITSAPKPTLETIIELPPGEPVNGRVLCDDILKVSRSSLDRPTGGLSRSTMSAVNTGLRVALGIV